MDGSSQTAVVPGSVPLTLLLALEAAAVLVWLIPDGRRRSRDPAALLLCARCTGLHAWSEAIGRVADGIAVGALAFLVALPFVAAGYERRFTVPDVVLAVSTVIAVLTAAAEGDFLVRAVIGRLSPRMRWRAPLRRIVGGGARWLGAVVAGYLFQPRSLGIAALLGDPGERLIRDLPSTATILAAATLLAAACFLALAARWLIPFLFGSFPMTLGARYEGPRRAA